MDWSQILYAAIGGGGGALLGTFIAFGVNKVFIRNKAFHYMTTAAFTAGLAVLGMNIVPGMYGNMQLPRVGTPVEQILLKTSPIYVEMQKHEPEYFNKIISKIDKSARKGVDETTIINEARKVLIELLADKVKYADSEVLTTMMEIARQNYLDFKQNKPYLCVLMINQRGMGDVAPYMSATSNALEQEYTLKIVQLPRNEAKVVDVEMAKKTEETTTAEIVKNIKPGDVLDLPADAPEEKLKRVCDLGVMSMDVILSLPEPERSNFIRNTLGQ